MGRAKGHNPSATGFDMVMGQRRGHISQGRGIFDPGTTTQGEAELEVLLGQVKEGNMSPAITALKREPRLVDDAPYAKTLMASIYSKLRSPAYNERRHERWQEVLGFMGASRWYEAALLQDAEGIIHINTEESSPDGEEDWIDMACGHLVRQPEEYGMVRKGDWSKKSAKQCQQCSLVIVGDEDFVQPPREMPLFDRAHHQDVFESVLKQQVQDRLLSVIHEPSTQSDIDSATDVAYQRAVAIALQDVFDGNLNPKMFRLLGASYGTKLRGSGAQRLSLEDVEHLLSKYGKPGLVRNPAMTHQFQQELFLLAGGKR